MTTGSVTALRRLTARLQEVGRQERERMDRLFRTLGARLAAARQIDRELDRVLANRFNPLDYLRTDELGLSRILGDLLDPHAAHGQGSAFLLRFLEKLGPHLPGGSLLAFERASVDTVCERSIGCAGRLDVSIEIKDGEQEPVCIAIENKPYAADGDGQVDAYLRFLKMQVPGAFSADLSVPAWRSAFHREPARTREHARFGHTLLLPAGVRHRQSGMKRRCSSPFALTDWLRECGLSCTVDRLRSFLRDTENFCHKTFGGVLTTDTEHREVRDFILESEENLRTTLTVLRAYPKVRNEVVEGFLKRLRKRVKRELKDDSFEVRCGFSDKPNAGDEGLWAWRSSWKGETSWPYIWLGHDRPDAAWWWLGVGFDPFARDDPDPRIERLREPLADRLGPPHAKAAKFPWYRYLEEPYRDWAPLLVRMHEEATQPGALIEHLSSQFVNLAKKAMDEIDGASRWAQGRRSSAAERSSATHTR